jgi:hypothetical protein
VLEAGIDALLVPRLLTLLIWPSVCTDGRPDKYKGSYYANPCLDCPTEDATLKEKYPSYCNPNIWPSKHLSELEPAFKELGKLIVRVGIQVAEQCDR